MNRRFFKKLVIFTTVSILPTPNIFNFLIAPAASDVLFTSSNLPIIIIDTRSQTIKDEYRIQAQMKIIYNAEGVRNNLTDPPNNYEGIIAIELRGSASISYPKKGYRFETQDSLGNNLNVSLIDLPEENDWILYGPYDDQSLIRNVLAYKLSNDIGRYASRTRFCELVLNNDYRGLYVLMEKIKRDKNRINIAELDSLDTTGDAVTGGYIFKFDKPEGENIGGWRSAYNIFYQYHYPKADEIIPEQKAYIRDFMNQFENAMTRPDFADSAYGYPKYINVASFVDHFILSEFCKNIDAYRISNYMFKDQDSKGGKLNEGPIWDYNLSFGKTWYPEDVYRVDEWEVDHNRYKPNDWPKVPFWWEKLGHDPTFARRVEARWRDLRSRILKLDNVYAMIDQLIDTIAEARTRNFERWPEKAKDHSYETEIEMMKQWISDRVDWIEENLGSLTSAQQQIESGPIPASFSLEQNYPNPFNSATTIKYQIPRRTWLTLTVYNLLGQEVVRLVDGEQEPGFFKILWDGKDRTGRTLLSGIYIFQLKTRNFMITRKMLLVR
jgi:hypothetical protein